MKQVVAAAARLRDLAQVKFLGVKAFLTRREEGASLVEYALLIALIALACVLALNALSGGISGLFNNIAANLNGVKT